MEVLQRKLASESTARTYKTSASQQIHHRISNNMAPAKKPLEELKHSSSVMRRIRQEEQREREECTMDEDRILRARAIAEGRVYYSTAEDGIRRLRNAYDDEKEREEAWQSQSGPGRRQWELKPPLHLRNKLTKNIGPSASTPRRIGITSAINCDYFFYKI